MNKSIAALVQQYLIQPVQKDFLVYYDAEGNRQSFSYLDFIRHIRVIRRFFQEKGIRRGERIATFMHNKPEQVMVYFAAWAAGICVVPLNIGESGQRIKYLLQASRAMAVFTVKSEVKRIQSMWSADEAGPCVYDSSHYLQTAAPAADSDMEMDMQGDAEDEAFLVYTSGTTGSPKGVILQQKHLIHDAEAIADWHGWDAGTRTMCILPIHHVNGTVVTLVTPFLVGGTTVLNEKFSASHFFRRAADEGIHVVSVVPTILEFLLAAGSDQIKPNSSLKYVICGAGPLLPDTAVRFESTFQIPVVHGYGLSETTCYSTFLPVGLSDSKRRMWLTKYGFPSIGRSIKHNDVKVVDAQGQETAEFVRGEIAVRGRTVMKGYDNRPDADREAFRLGGGWFLSGDEGFYTVDDESGEKFFFITGRMKELIIRGGVNISPLEIDDVLRRHPKVQFGLSVPFENRWYGEEIAAYVVLKDDMTADEAEIISFCSRFLPFSKRPKVVVFGSSIPYTSTGKPKRIRLKLELQNELRAYRDVQFREKK